MSSIVPSLKDPGFIKTNKCNNREKFLNYKQPKTVNLRSSVVATFTCHSSYNQYYGLTE